jgi:hypothetical protein
MKKEKKRKEKRTEGLEVAHRKPNPCAWGEGQTRT